MKFFAPYQKRLLKPSIFRRILAVNILALLTLVVGLLYVDRYRISLIESEVGYLSVQAEIFAATLGEAATNNKLNNENLLNRARADQIIRRLAKKGKSIYYLTNNTSKNTKHYIRKLNNLNLPVSTNSIISPIHVMIDWIKKK